MRTFLSKISPWTYTLSAAVFLVGVLVQVFLAGLAVVARRAGWSSHIDLGHALGIPLILMLLTMVPARLPVGPRRMTVLLFAVYVLQADVVIYLRSSLPAVAALHPVLALFDFLLAMMLAGQGYRLLSAKTAGESADQSVAGRNLLRGA